MLPLHDSDDSDDYCYYDADDDDGIISYCYNNFYNSKICGQKSGDALIEHVTLCNI